MFREQFVSKSSTNLILLFIFVLLKPTNENMTISVRNKIFKIWTYNVNMVLKQKLYLWRALLRNK